MLFFHQLFVISLTFVEAEARLYNHKKARQTAISQWESCRQLIRSGHNWLIDFLHAIFPLAVCNLSCFLGSSIQAEQAQESKRDIKHPIGKLRTGNKSEIDIFDLLVVTMLYFHWLFIISLVFCKQKPGSTSTGKQEITSSQ